VPHANGESHRGRPLVLIVDANPATVEEMAATVRTKDYAVLTALTFEDGKAIWRSQLPDVLIVDIRLGQYNGLQLLIRARADRPGVTAVVTSPVADSVLEAEAVGFGGTFLIKPVSSRQLLDAIQKPTLVDVQFVSPNRRQTDRRQYLTPDFVPERRVRDRRHAGFELTPPPDSQYDRRSGPDRRQLIVPGHQPDRRQRGRRMQ